MTESALVIEWTSKEHLNRCALSLFERFRASSGFVRVFILGTDQHSDVGFFGPVSRIHEFPSDIKFAYLPAVNGNAEFILKAFELGMPVIQNDLYEETSRNFDDLQQGFFGNHQADWFSKIFPDPIHVARPSNLQLSLGSTINPRSIVLNAGRVEVKGGGAIVIGRASHIGADALLNLGAANLKVGNFSIVSANFSVHGMRHSISHISSFAITRGPFSFFGSVFDEAKDVELGHDVWVGERVTCLPGVKIANGSVIGAGSVVTKSTEPYGIYVGNPAKLIRYRFDAEKRQFLQESQWWDYSYSYLVKIQNNFKVNISNMPISELKNLL